jgi:cytochrome P450
VTNQIPELDIDPYSSENLLNPYPMHEVMREAGPLIKLKDYPTYACARYDQVHSVLTDHETFISGAGVGLTNFNLEKPFRPKSLILEADPPQHTQMRTILSRRFSQMLLALKRMTEKIYCFMAIWFLIQWVHAMNY